MTQFRSDFKSDLKEYINCDLSRYFIVRKFSDGWLMGSQNGPESIFVPRTELVRMGYLSEEAESISASLSSAPQDIPSPRVITIPLTNEFRRRSLSGTEQKPDWINPEIVIDNLDLDIISEKFPAQSLSCPNPEPHYLEKDGPVDQERLEIIEEFGQASDDLFVKDKLKKHPTQTDSDDDLIFKMTNLS